MPIRVHRSSGPYGPTRSPAGFRTMAPSCRRGLVWLGMMLSAATALLGGCGQHGTMSRFMLTPDRIIIERRPDPVYDQLFPYYVELCATSQFRSSAKGRGGVTGHAVLYIKGACKDEQAPFPQLRRCRVIATDLDDPEHGAGISVGRWFRNVNWVAVPGYDLFFRGQPRPRPAPDASSFRRHRARGHRPGRLPRRRASRLPDDGRRAESRRFRPAPLHRHRPRAPVRAVGLLRARARDRTACWTR